MNLQKYASTSLSSIPLLGLSLDRTLLYIFPSLFLVETRASHIPRWALTHCIAKDNLGYFIACLHLQSAGITRVHDHTWFYVALEVKSRASCGRQALCQMSSIPIPHQYTFKNTMYASNTLPREDIYNAFASNIEYLPAVFCKSCKNILSAPSNTEKWRWGHSTAV